MMDTCHEEMGIFCCVHWFACPMQVRYTTLVMCTNLTHFLEGDDANNSVYEGSWSLRSDRAQRLVLAFFIQISQQFRDISLHKSCVQTETPDLIDNLPVQRAEECTAVQALFLKCLCWSLCFFLLYKTRSAHGTRTWFQSYVPNLSTRTLEKKKAPKKSSTVSRIVGYGALGNNLHGRIPIHFR